VNFAILCNNVVGYICYVLVGYFSSNDVFLCGFIECIFVSVRFALHCYKIKVFKHDNWALQGIYGRKRTS
jgi:hypothetical protein